MKNKKIVFVFILIITFLLLMVNYTQASEGYEELNVLQGNGTNNENVNNENVENNEIAGNNEELANVNNNVETNNQVNNTNTNTLPQTGVEDNPTLFIFIAICIVSAVYAYIKIRKYNNIH